MAEKAKPFEGLKEAGEKFKQLREGIDQVHELINGLRELAEYRVMVGIPASAKPRRSRDGKKEINNATLLFIHEHGSPAANIPARPSLHPGIRESKREWGEHLKEAAKAALESKESQMIKSFHKAGMVASAAVKKKIIAGIPPPLKPITVALRRQRHPSRKATDPRHVTPLVDTAQMLNAITYVVQKSGRTVKKV